MSENVVRAFGAPPPDERQKLMLELLEAATEKVKLGIVSSMAVVTVDKSGAADMDYASGRWLELLGAVDRLRNHIHADVDEQLS